jgi:membrane protein DedA with SNARE-associated domain
MLDGLIEWLARLPAGPTYVVLMALAAVENVFPPVPADVAVALGAFLAQRGEISALTLGVLCWLSNTVSSAGMYFLARRHAEVFRSGWGRKLLKPGARAAFEHAYKRYGVLGIFLSRFLPGFRATVTPLAGLIGLPPLRTLVPAALASALWYAFLIVVGSALGLTWDGIKEFLGGVNRVLAVLAAAAALGLGIWLRRRARAQR